MLTSSNSLLEQPPRSTGRPGRSEMFGQNHSGFIPWIVGLHMGYQEVRRIVSKSRITQVSRLLRLLGAT